MVCLEIINSILPFSIWTISLNAFHEVQRKYKELYDEAAKHKLDITELKKAEAAEKYEEEEEA